MSAHFLHTIRKHKHASKTGRGALALLSILLLLVATGHLGRRTHSVATLAPEQVGQGLGVAACFSATPGPYCESNGDITYSVTWNDIHCGANGDWSFRAHIRSTSGYDGWDVPVSCNGSTATFRGGFTPGVSYEIYLYGNNTGFLYDISPAQAAPSCSGAPSVPTNLSGSCTGTTVNLSWNSNSVSHWALRIDDLVNGWNTGCDGVGPINPGDVCGNTVSNPWTGIGNGTPGHSYHWWVHSCNAWDNSDCSAPAESTFSCAPNAPTGVAVSCSAGTVTMSWNGSYGTTAYQPEFDGKWVCPAGWTTYLPNGRCYIPNYGGTSVSFPGNPGRTYAVNVGGGNSGGWNWASWSGAPSATCPGIPPPAAPASMSYTCGSGGTSVTFSWPTSVGATLYYPRYHTTSGSCSAGWTLWSDGTTCYQNSLSGTSATATITPGVSYYGWVRAGDPVDWTKSAGTGTFSCPASSLPPPPPAPPPPPPAPASMNYSCALSGTSVTFSWPTSVGATLYYPRYHTTSGACSVGWGLWSDGTTCYQNNLSGTSATATITPGVSYYGWVHAGDPVDWTQAANSAAFRCAAPPPPSAALSLVPMKVRVKKGTATTLTWSAQNVTSCTLKSPTATIDSPAAVGNNIASHGVSSGPIFSKTLFTLSCIDMSGVPKELIVSVGVVAIINEN